MRNVINIDDVCKLAEKRLPKFVFDFVAGGAEDEVTLEANRRCWQDVKFRPRVLVDVSSRDTGTTIFGERVSLPVLASPAGFQRLVSRHGELDGARAACRAGTSYLLSTSSNYSIEEVAAVATRPLWFQLYPWINREAMAWLISRAQKAGYCALCFSVDAPTLGKRERDMRNAIPNPPRATFKTVMQAIRRPAWVRDYLLGPGIEFKNYVAEGSGGAVLKYSTQQLIRPEITWDEVAWIRKQWAGPLVIKGIMTTDDAQLCIDHGADGLVVSNHGGRFLDGVPATIEVLPEIVDVVAGRIEVFIDGGIRRGSDVVKAVALGARAAMIGKSFLFGLAAGGENGGVRVLEILRDEIDRTLTLLGRRSIAELDRSAVSIGR